MHPKTTQNTLAEELQLSEVDVHKLYDAMDWLLERQTCIENKLAKKHSKDRALLLFDVSSSSDTADPKTFTHIVAHIRRRLDITNVVFVGDRGMITTKRIEEDRRDLNGLDWISAFHTEGIRSLVDAGKIRHSLFD